MAVSKRVKCIYLYNNLFDSYFFLLRKYQILNFLCR